MPPVAIPNSPTEMWVIAAAVVIGGSLMALSLRHGFRTIKELSSATNTAVSEMLGFCERTDQRTTSTIERVCKSHETFGAALAKEVKDMKIEIVRHGEKTSGKLNQIHEDIQRLHPKGQ